MKTIVDLVEEQKKYLLEKDTAAKQAVEANIAPVEADASSASRIYVVGDQLFLNDVLYDVTSPISVGDAIVVGTNITAANKLSADIKSKNQAFMKQITANGAVNELDHTGVTDTSGTVKFTVNEDKSITVSANSYPVTLDSTTTFFFFGTASAAVPNIFKGKKLVGCPSGGASGTYRITIQEFSSTTPSGAVAETSDVGEGANISNGDYIRMYICLGSGYQLTSALTFKPMISLPELGLSYDDYVPYAKSNKELTDESELITLPVTKNDSIADSFVIRVRKQHNAVYVTGYFSISVAANKSDLLFTISDLNFFDANDHFYILMMSSDGGISFAEVFSNGEVKVGRNDGMPIGYYMVDAVLLMK